MSRTVALRQLLRLRRPRRAVVAVAVAGLLLAGHGTASAAPGDVPSVMTTWSVPAVPVLGEEFRVYFGVTVGGAPATGTVDVTFDGGTTLTLPLTDGVYSAGILRSAPGPFAMSAAYLGGPGVLPSSATYSYTFPVPLTAQTITFDAAPPASVTFGDAAVPVAASSDSGLDVTLGVSGPCALDAGSLSFTGAGTCTVTATQAGDATYAPASATATVTIGRAPTVTTITLGSVAPTRTDFSVDVTAGGVSLTTGTLTFEVEGNTATGWATPFSGSYVGGSGYRTYTLTATYSGTADYLPSTATVVVDVVDPRLPQTVTFDPAPPADVTWGDAAVPVAASSDSGLGVTLAVDGPCALAAGSLSFTGAGTCTVTASQAGDATHKPAEAIAVVTVAKATSVTTITPVVVSLERVAFLMSATVDGVAATEGSLAFDVNGGEVGWGGLGTEVGLAYFPPTPRLVTLTVTYTGSANILPSSATMTVDVRLAQTIGLDAALPDSAQVLGTLALPATTSEDLAVAYSTTTPAVCTVDGTTLSLHTAGTCSVAGTNAGDDSRKPVTEAVSLTVTHRPQTITITGAPATFDGAGEFTVRALTDGTAFVFVGASGACRATGDDVAVITVTGVGVCSIVASSDGDEVTAPGLTTVQVLVTAGSPDLSLVLGAVVGDRVQGTSVIGTGTDLLPGAALSVTAYSTPTVVGSTLAEPDGATTVVGVLPALAAGTHRVVLEGTALDGTSVRTEVAFGVGADRTITWIGQAPAGMAATGTDVGGTGALAALAVLTGLGLLVLRRRLVLTPA